MACRQRCALVPSSRALPRSWGLSGWEGEHAAGRGKFLLCFGSQKRETPTFNHPAQLQKRAPRITKCSGIHQVGNVEEVFRNKNHAEIACQSSKKGVKNPWRWCLTSLWSRLNSFSGNRQLESVSWGFPCCFYPTKYRIVLKAHLKYTPKSRDATEMPKG